MQTEPTRDVLVLTLETRCWRRMFSLHARPGQGQDVEAKSLNKFPSANSNPFAVQNSFAVKGFQTRDVYAPLVFSAKRSNPHPSLFATAWATPGGGAVTRGVEQSPHDAHDKPTRREQDKSVDAAIAVALAASAPAANAAHAAATRLAEELSGGFDGSAAAGHASPGHYDCARLSPLRRRTEHSSNPAVPDTFPMEKVEVRYRWADNHATVYRLEVSRGFRLSICLLFSVVGCSECLFFVHLLGVLTRGEVGCGERLYRSVSGGGVLAQRG